MAVRFLKKIIYYYTTLCILMRQLPRDYDGRDVSSVAE